MKLEKSQRQPFCTVPTIQKLFLFRSIISSEVKSNQLCH